MRWRHDYYDYDYDCDYDNDYDYDYETDTTVGSDALGAALLPVQEHDGISHHQTLFAQRRRRFVDTGAAGDDVLDDEALVPLLEHAFHHFLRPVVLGLLLIDSSCADTVKKIHALQAVDILVPCASMDAKETQETNQDSGPPCCYTTQVTESGKSPCDA